MEQFVVKVFLMSIIGATVASSTQNIRIDCHPDKDSTEAGCVQRGCIWEPTEHGVPWCIFSTEPARMAGYNATTLSAAGGVLQRRHTPTIYGNDHPQLIVTVLDMTDQIFTVQLDVADTGTDTDYDDNQQAQPHQNEDDNEDDISKEFTDGTCSDSIDQEYCEEQQLLNSPDSDSNSDSVTHSSGSYQAVMYKTPFALSVARKAADPCKPETPIFDTNGLPGMTFSKRFIQISTRVPTPNVYGIGEQYHEQLRRNFNWQRLSLFNKDQYPIGDSPLYGAHPFYLGLDSTNQSYGVFVESTYPMDVYLQPSPELLTFRILGGTSVKLHFFLGPSTDNVIEQYLWMVGLPLMPPYWALGFHLSRFGYNSLHNLKKVYNRNRAAQMPQDTQWLDIDYLDGRKDFTLSKEFEGINAFVRDTIHAQGRKLVPILDPAIPSNASHYAPLKYGCELGVFIKDSRSGKPLQGRVWPGSTYFPDFTNPKTIPYWRNLLSNFSQILDFDGIWIDMNDPSNFVDGSLTGCEKNDLNNPPFLPVNYEPLYQKTICLDAQQYAGSHLQWHNQYGHLEAKATHKALSHLNRDRRSFVLSRSTAPGTGSFAAHWLGDTESTWASLGQSLIGALEFNMFGIPLTGADICGFNKNTTEELCKRWSQLGAFYPFARNHNTDDAIDQDPAAWPERTRNTIREALQVRYSLLPYLYTLFYQASTQGTPVLRAMFYDHAADPNTWNMHEQVLWGQALLIAPILLPNTQSRSVYFPKGVWYSYKGGLVPNSKQNRWRTVAMHHTTDSLFIKGGHIIPVQSPAVTTALARHSPLGLMVALDSQGTATGLLYWDSGDDPRALVLQRHCLVSVAVSQQELVIMSNVHDCKMSTLGWVLVQGVPSAPKQVQVNRVAHAEYFYDKQLYLLNITTLRLVINTGTTSTITWKPAKSSTK